MVRLATCFCQTQSHAGQNTDIDKRIVYTLTQHFPHTFTPTAVQFGSAMEPWQWLKHASLSWKTRYGSICWPARPHFAYNPHFISNNRTYSPISQKACSLSLPHPTFCCFKSLFPFSPYFQSGSPWTPFLPQELTRALDAVQIAPGLKPLGKVILKNRIASLIKTPVSAIASPLPNTSYCK